MSSPTMPLSPVPGSPTPTSPTTPLGSPTPTSPTTPLSLPGSPTPTSPSTPLLLPGSPTPTSPDFNTTFLPVVNAWLVSFTNDQLDPTGRIVDRPGSHNDPSTHVALRAERVRNVLDHSNGTIPIVVYTFHPPRDTGLPESFEMFVPRDLWSTPRLNVAIIRNALKFEIAYLLKQHPGQQPLNVIMNKYWRSKRFESFLLNIPIEKFGLPLPLAKAYPVHLAKDGSLTALPVKGREAMSFILFLKEKGRNTSIEVPETLLSASHAEILEALLESVRRFSVVTKD